MDVCCYEKKKLVNSGKNEKKGELIISVWLSCFGKKKYIKISNEI
jgi:hypothetical protein